MTVSAEACRRFLRRALNLDAPLAGVADAVRCHGYVQIDPIDVCGRMHDLILRNRVAGYQRDALLQLIYGQGERTFFEQYLPGRNTLAVFPVEDYRYLRPTMRLRARTEGGWGAISATEKPVATKILRRLREEGPLGVAELADGARAIGVWGTSGTLAKHTLDKLCFHGRVMVSRREKFRRIYDLPERVLPGEVLAAKPAAAREANRWRVLKELQQKRLVRLSAAQRELVEDAVQALNVEGQPMLFCLRQDVDELRAAEHWPKPPGSPLLLAPLDPLIYDRKLTATLWNFPYTWEVYVPPAKRVRGYYAMPVLAGTRIVGHVDPKADRASGTLQCRIAVPRGFEVLPALNELARFLELESVVLQNHPRSLC